MTNSKTLSSLILCLSLLGLAGCPGPSNTDSVDNIEIALPKPGFYTVDHYDESRDPIADLAKAVEQGAQEKKRIFVQVGGDWCSWCVLMTKFIENNRPVRAALEKDYLVMKVSYSKAQPNKAFLSQYPKTNGFPHVYIFDTDGTLLHSQDTGELEAGNGYDEHRYLDFLAKWAP